MVIYLDSNQFFRVFERETSDLFPAFSSALKRHGITLAVSEVNIFEAYQGAARSDNRTAVSSGMALLDGLGPVWLPLGILERNEILTAAAEYCTGTKPPTASPFLSLSEILVIASDSGRIFDPSEYAKMKLDACFDELFKRG